MTLPERKVIFDQIHRLVAVPAHQAPEGVIFYSARALEGACKGLVARLDSKPSNNVFSNLMTIEAHRLIDNLAKELSHTLRRMGNGVRHSLEDSTQEDTQLAVVLTRAVIQWLDSLDRVEDDAEAIALLDQRIDPSWPVVEAVRILGRVEQGDHQAIEQLLQLQDKMLSSRFLATLCAEALIGCGRAAEAGELLLRSANAYGADQRHQQLSALVLSRTGRLEEAEKAATKLINTYKDDDETAGIAGGIFKRRWDRDHSQIRALDKAHELYRKQWEKGGRINAYLGVNAAATAIYRGDAVVARAIAETIVAAMARRDLALERAGLHPQDDGVSDYYDRVSRAEALLLSGKTEEAYEAYVAAFGRYSLLSGHIDGTKAQATRIAATLGLGDFTL